MEMPQFVYSFNYGRAPWLLSIFGSEQNRYKYSCAGFFVDIRSQLLWINTQEYNYWSYSKTMINFVRNCQTVFQSGCTIFLFPPITNKNYYYSSICFFIILSYPSSPKLNKKSKGQWRNWGLLGELREGEEKSCQDGGNGVNIPFPVHLC